MKLWQRGNPRLLLVALLFYPLLAGAQAEQANIEALKKTAPRVFIDCGRCDIEYIKTEITFVNYVRDRKEAQVHLLITTQRTASDGLEYTLSFMGQNEFQDMNDIQKYFSNKTDTEDEVRQGLVKVIKIGLMGYVARTPIARRIAVSYEPESKPAPKADKWKSWIFNLGAHGYFNGEKSYSYQSLDFSFSASRTTPDIKIRLGLSADFSSDSYTYDDYTYESTQESYSFTGLAVKSLGPHWSAGLYLEAYSSSYSNIRLSITPAPAVEYNLFPYSQSTRRQLRFLYRVGYKNVRYREQTIYLKTAEQLWSESLSATLELREKWGSISTTLAGSHYFHDFSKYRLTLFTSLNLNLFKGLSLSAFASGARINDQLSLARAGASLEEIILRRTELETSYNYFFSIGLNYTFGSIYTNVVNPRFGSLHGGGMRIIID